MTSLLISQTIVFFIPKIPKDKLGWTLYYFEITPNDKIGIRINDIERILSNYSSLYNVSSTLEDIPLCPSTSSAENENEEMNNTIQKTLSPMSLSIKVSATSYFNAIAKEIKSDKYPLISLAVGEPDFHPPKEVIKATGRAAEDGFYRYSPILGLESLRLLISNDYKLRKHVDYNINEICLCNGGTQACTEVYIFNMYINM